MQMLWCWRCQTEVPMLDEDEWTEVETVLYPRDTGSGRPALPQRLRQVSEVYERLTGWRGVHANAVVHHRASQFGPPCRSCGRPLRTPRASFCAACGADVTV